MERRHDSIRGWFAAELHTRMESDDAIRVISCDLGYGMFNQIKQDYPDRFINVGASEQAGMGVAVGMAMEGLKPFIYSISPFLIYRSAETIRNYINHENIPVRLVCSGRNRDYSHDGFSHDATDITNLLNSWLNIEELWPNRKEEVPSMVKQMVEINRPWFISLSRNETPIDINVMKAIRDYK